MRGDEFRTEDYQRDSDTGARLLVELLQQFGIPAPDYKAVTGAEGLCMGDVFIDLDDRLIFGDAEIRGGYHQSVWERDTTPGHPWKYKLFGETEPKVNIAGRKAEKCTAHFHVSFDGISGQNAVVLLMRDVRAQKDTLVATDTSRGQDRVAKIPLSHTLTFHRKNNLWVPCMICGGMKENNLSVHRLKKFFKFV
jgi:hypothetical protein